MMWFQPRKFMQQNEETGNGTQAVPVGWPIDLYTPQISLPSENSLHNLGKVFPRRWPTRPTIPRTRLSTSDGAARPLELALFTDVKVLLAAWHKKCLGTRTTVEVRNGGISFCKYPHGRQPNAVALLRLPWTAQV
jgi:hypothetical protein